MRKGIDHTAVWLLLDAPCFGVATKVTRGVKQELALPLKRTLLVVSCQDHCRNHQENMSVKCIPPPTPHLYGKTGVCWVIPVFFCLFVCLFVFLIFFLLQILGESVLTSTHNVCFVQKVKNIKHFW